MNKPRIAEDIYSPAYVSLESKITNAPTLEDLQVLKNEAQFQNFDSLVRVANFLMKANFGVKHGA